MSLLTDLFRAKVANMDYNMKNEATDEVGYPTGFILLDFLTLISLMDLSQKNWTNLQERLNSISI